MSEYYPKTKIGLVEQWRENVKEIISELIEPHLIMTTGLLEPDGIEKFLDATNILDEINDEIFVSIDSCQETIYTWRAIEISRIIGEYDAFDNSEITGERFENWTQVAFENIYHLIYSELDFEELIKEVVKETHSRFVGPFPANS